MDKVNRETVSSNREVFYANDRIKKIGSFSFLIYLINRISELTQMLHLALKVAVRI